MASNTENLDLLMKNPSTDGADTFNVQTMLNENWQKIDNNAGTVAQTLANILKPTTPPLIGLPPSTTPDGMFQALGNTGELHVWRKTARDASVSAPGYNLGDIKSLTDICQAPSGYQGYFGVKAEYSDEVTVNNLGVISLVSPSEIEIGFTGETAAFLPEGADNTLKNKFLKIVSVLAEQPNAKILDSYKDAVIHCESNFHCDGYGSSSPGYNIYFKNFRLVTSYPAGLSTTYPVSTNPNAYQEGSDAKPAGYTLGEVVTGSFALTVRGNGSTSINWDYSAAINVSTDGKISLTEETGATINAYGYASNGQLLKGKFCKTSYEGTDFTPNETVFIPADASISQSGDKLVVDRYQPVIGYPAIPAGTTIEYLGKLGDKARVQVVSYVGTGTYGESNPCSITADFKIKVAIYLKSEDWYQSSSKWVEIADDLKTQYQQQHGFVYGKVSNAWGKRSSDSKTITWYNTYSNSAQLNASGVKYTFLIIG